jgi:hypothetical protein
MHSIIMVTRYSSMYSSILVLQRHVSKIGELETSLGVEALFSLLCTLVV